MRAALAYLATRLRADRRAATAVEYALIGSLVAGAAMAGMLALGVSLDLIFTDEGEFQQNYNGTIGSGIVDGDRYEVQFTGGSFGAPAGTNPLAKLS